MTTIVEFLTARLAEDEAAARAAIKATADPTWGTHTYRVVSGDGSFEVADASVPSATHIARHDPARALREVEAKRRIVALHEIVESTSIPGEPSADDGGEGCSICADYDGWVYPTGPCDTLRALASVYADHPDFDPAWAVEVRA